MTASTRRPGRGRRQHVMVVQSTERLTPHLVRVFLGGPDVRTFIDAADPARLAATDKYVKLLIPPLELGLQPPYDLEALRSELPIDQLPAQRTYTVRSVDLDAGAIALDFVVHGNEGVAGPWAADAQPGDLLALSGPGGGYRPSQHSAAPFLLLGDESAVPAIGAALEAMTPDATGTAIIEVHGSDDELHLAHPPGIDLRWVHRSSMFTRQPTDGALARAVLALTPPNGPVEVFAHGERGAMQAIRAVLQDDWGLDRRAMSLSAYWALGRVEDQFQAEKREPVGQIFADASND